MTIVLRKYIILYEKEKQTKSNFVPPLVVVAFAVARRLVQYSINTCPADSTYYCAVNTQAQHCLLRSTYRRQYFNFFSSSESRIYSLQCFFSVCCVVLFTYIWYVNMTSETNSVTHALLQIYIIDTIICEMNYTYNWYITYTHSLHELRKRQDTHRAHTY